MHDDISSIEGLKGSRGNDNIGGTAGTNLLWGNEGDDAINGYGGLDVVDGGAGNDTLTLDFNASAGGIYSGGSGSDTLVFNLSTADLANLALRQDLSGLGLQLLSEQTRNFTFTAMTLSVDGIENLVVTVDGVTNTAP